MSVFEVISPHTEQPIAQVTAAEPADVDAAVGAARTAFDTGPWGRAELAERIAAIRRLADSYDRRRAEMAEVITAEIGAPITFSQRAQVGLPALMMRAFCDLAERHRWQENRPGFFGSDVLVRKQPVGVVAAIVPWNMPQFLIATKLVPALLAGCTVVLKPAPESPLDALLLAEMINEIGLPPGVVSVLPGGAAIGEQLVTHRGVDKVSFTGSTAAGRAVAAACGTNLTKVSLELGGKSAAIVLDDAAPEKVAAGVRSASLSNSGQICNALTRVRNYIDVGRTEGARMVLGGTELPDGLDRGWYVRPTLFAAVDNSMRIAREEIFGPVITVIPYRDEDDALAIANDSDYGLAGSVWSADTERALAIASRVRTGTLGINQGYTMDPFAPFGGVKGSGYGRELGPEGIDGYLETTSIAVAPGT